MSKLSKIIGAVTGRNPEQGNSPDAIARIQQRHAAALAAVETAAAEYREANLAAELAEDGDDASAAARRDRAATALAGARKRVADLADALRGAEAREAERARAAAAADAVRGWADAIKLAGERADAAAAAEAAIAALAEAQSRLNSINVRIATACPIDLDIDATLLTPRHIEPAVRLAMVKSGLKWALAWPWEVERIPSLSSRVAGANRELGLARERAGA